MSIGRNPTPERTNTVSPSTPPVHGEREFSMKRLLASALSMLLGFAGAQVQAQDKLPAPKDGPVSKEVGKAPAILEGGACDNGNCNERGGHVVGGLGVYFLQPNF